MSPEGSQFLNLDFVGSTQDEALKIAQNSTESGSQPTGFFWVRAQSQEKGRGRLPGRRWISERGENLLLSVAAPAPTRGRPLGTLPLLCGSIGYRAIQTIFGTGRRLGLKWPNDIVVLQDAPLTQGALTPLDIRDWRKLGGILVELRAGWLVAGWGINVLSAPLGQSTCVAREVPGGSGLGSEAIDELAQELRSIFEATYPIWAGDLGAAHDPARLQELQSGPLAWMIGRAFTIQDPRVENRKIHGVFRGVTDSGHAILVDSSGHRHEISWGEIRRD